MAMKFTQIPATTFEKLQLNAGILVDSFDPASGTIGNLLGATTGGIQFSTAPEFSDMGEDIDNCPNGMMELKKLTGYDASISGTFLSITPAVIKMLMPAADISSSTHIVPRTELATGDFTSLWWVGDYSDVNTGANAGFLAIHMMNALNTAGFQIQSGKDAKGQMAFEFHAHYSMANQSTVPFEVYCVAGTSSSVPTINLSTHYVALGVDDVVNLGVETSNTSSTVTWSSSATGKAEVSNGAVTGKAAGTAIITASITDDGVTYNDTCTVVVS